MKIRIIFLIILTAFTSEIFSQYKHIERGIASYYHDHLSHKTTANGEIYKPQELTAAHLTLPFNSIVSVTNLNNNKTIVVRINDRGPFIYKRIIDLSKAAADSLDFIYQGLTNVVIKVLHLGKPVNTTSVLTKNEPSVKISKPTTKQSKIVKNTNLTSDDEVKIIDKSNNEAQNYGVQVSSFKIKENMIKFSEKLKKEYNEIVNVQQTYIDNILHYRVIIGEFKTEQESTVFFKKIENKFKGCFKIKY